MDMVSTLKTHSINFELINIELIIFPSISVMKLMRCELAIVLHQFNIN